MKKFKVFTLALIVFFTNTVIVNAACTTEEKNKLNSLGANVKASYEIKTELVDPGDEYSPPDGLTEEEMENYKTPIDYFYIYISNITEELYIEITDKSTGEKTKYTYSDIADGVITIKKTVGYEIKNYTIIVYSSSKTNCPDTKLQTLYITTPAFNEFSMLQTCEGIEEFYLCHEYLTVEVSFDNFYELAEKYRAGKVDKDGDDITEPDKDKSFKEFIKENKGVIIGVTLSVILIGGLVTVIIVKRQRSRVV